MKIIFFGIVTFILLSSVSVFGQTEYAHGNGALELFDSEGMAASPLWVRVWVMFMLTCFAASLLFVAKHSIARWVAGCFVLGMVVLTLLTKGLGVPNLSGFIACIHLLFWSPALYKLVSERPFMGPRSAFSIWSGLMTAVIVFSFVFDIRDAIIYIRHLL